MAGRLIRPLSVPQVPHVELRDVVRRSCGSPGEIRKSM